MSARRATEAQQLQAVCDSAAVLKSDLLDAAALTHPERLGQLEQLLGQVEVIRGHAVAGLNADAESLDEVSEEMTASAAETVESLETTINELTGDTADHELATVMQRIRTLRDSVASLQDDDVSSASRLATAAANQASIIRGQLLVLAISQPNLPRGAVRAARRAAVHLESELMDYAAVTSQQNGGTAPAHLARLLTVTDTLMQDLTTLREASFEQERDVILGMIADAERTRTDVRNLSRNPEYAPRQRLDDIYGRITRIIEQSDAYAPRATDRTAGPLRVVQADLAACRELALGAATEQLGVVYNASSRLFPQMVNIDLSAEEQLGVKLDVHNGGVTLARVSQQGPASQAGLRRGDVLLTANERRIETDVDLASEVEAAVREGKSLRLELNRDGRRITRQISIGSAARHANRSSDADGNR